MLFSIDDSSLHKQAAVYSPASHAILKGSNSVPSIPNQMQQKKVPPTKPTQSTANQTHGIVPTTPAAAVAQPRVRNKKSKKIAMCGGKLNMFKFHEYVGPTSVAGRKSVPVATPPTNQPAVNPEHNGKEESSGDRRGGRMEVMEGTPYDIMLEQQRLLLQWQLKQQQQHQMIAAVDSCNQSQQSQQLCSVNTNQGVTEKGNGCEVMSSVISQSLTAVNSSSSQPVFSFGSKPVISPALSAPVVNGVYSIALTTRLESMKVKF